MPRLFQFRQNKKPLDFKRLGLYNALDLPKVGYLLVFHWEVVAMSKTTIINTICNILQTVAIIYGVFFK